jgi:hypothetical protein
MFIHFSFLLLHIHTRYLLLFGALIMHTRGARSREKRAAANSLDYVIMAAHYTLFFHMIVPGMKTKHDSR